MPDIPQVPGVPSLQSYAANDFVLAVSDAVSLVASLVAPQWGVYVDGSPVITPATIATQALAGALGALSTIAALVGVPNVVPCVASTVRFSFSGDSPIATYPQENGAFQSYNKVQLSSDIRLVLACGGPPAQRAAFFSTLRALRQSTVLVDILTPEGAFIGYNCVHLNWDRAADRGANLVQAEVGFKEVVEVNATSFGSSDTKNPGDAATVGGGSVQAMPAPSSVQQQFDSQSASEGLF